MSLYSAPADRITFTDIRAFLDERHPESQILDYKRDWTEHLARTMAAMSNTSGGLVIIGVEEDGKSGCPRLPVCGVELGAGFDEIKRRVESIAYDGVYPPLFPDVVAVSVPGTSDRAVVVARMSQSHQAPHATDDRRRIYIRLECQDRYIDQMANLDQLAWLWEKRRASVALRQQMLARAAEIATALLREGASDLSGASATLELVAVPYLPSLASIELECLVSFAHERSAHSRAASAANSFPEGSYVRPVVDGAVRFEPSRSTSLSCAQLNKWGMVHGWLWVGPDSTGREGSQRPPFLYAVWLIAHFDAFLRYLQVFAEHFQMTRSGLFQISVHLRVQGDLRILIGEDDSEPSDPRRSRVLVSPLLLLEETGPLDSLLSQRRGLLVGMARTMLWSAGYEWAGKDAWLAKWLDERVPK